MGAWHSSAGSERGETLADALDRMIPLLNEHMGLEEERIRPIVEKYITVTEWEEMVKEGVARIRPENVPLVFGMLMYEGGLEIVPPAARGHAGAGSAGVRVPLRARSRERHPSSQQRLTVSSSPDNKAVFAQSSA